MTHFGQNYINKHPFPFLIQKKTKEEIFVSCVRSERVNDMLLNYSHDYKIEIQLACIFGFSIH